jgi:type II secretory pathway pseudopilin PulG
MANQSIALQARAPQTDILGGAIRNNAAMINMMSQQQAAQRQNALAEQTMQIQKAEEARKTAMAAPQLAEAQSKAGSARMDFMVKAVGHALHTSVNNPTDETLDQAATTLAGIGLSPAEIDREITPIKQLPLDQRKAALMQSILSDPNSKAAFEATLPKPVQMKLGDRVVTVDQNPLSSTFNQPIRTDVVGMTPAQANPAGKVVQDNNGNYVVVNTHVPGPVMASGGGIPGQRGGVGVQPGQYGAAIESAAMQLAPGTTVSGRGRTPERNAQVGGVANSYHLTDNARDLQPAKGQSLDQLAAALAPLKQQGFDVMIERGRNHVHVEPGPGMARGGAAPAAGGGQLQGRVKGAKTANPAAEAKAAQRKTALTNELQQALDLVQDPSNLSAFQSSKKTWWDNQSQSILHGTFNPKTAEFGVHTALPGGVAHKSVWDRVTKHLIGAMYQTIEPGQAGMNRAVASQKMHVQMMGGGDNPSRETLIEAIKSTAADYGIKLNERGGGSNGQVPAAGRSTTGDPEMDAIMRKHGGKK